MLASTSVVAMAEAATDHRRATAERNAEAILDAAERLLRDRQQASIVAVAREAGVSRVTVYGHFSTKEELLEAVATRAVRAAATAVEEAEPDQGPPIEALDRVISASWRELERQEAVRMAVAEELGSEAVRRAHESAAAILGDLIDRGRADGAFRTDLPAEWLTTSFFGLAHAAADEVRAERMPADAAREAFATSIRELFVGPRGRL